jgi:hypothetical protein
MSESSFFVLCVVSVGQLLVKLAITKAIAKCMASVQASIWLLN